MPSGDLGGKTNRLYTQSSTDYSKIDHIVRDINNSYAEYVKTIGHYREGGGLPDDFQDDALEAALVVASSEVTNPDNIGKLTVELNSFKIINDLVSKHEAKTSIKSFKSCMALREIVQQGRFDFVKYFLDNIKDEENVEISHINSLFKEVNALHQTNPFYQTNTFKEDPKKDIANAFRHQAFCYVDSSSDDLLEYINDTEFMKSFDHKGYSPAMNAAAKFSVLLGIISELNLKSQDLESFINYGSDGPAKKNVFEAALEGDSVTSNFSHFNGLFAQGGKINPDNITNIIDKIFPQNITVCPVIDEYMTSFLENLITSAAKGEKENDINKIIDWFRQRDNSIGDSVKGIVSKVLRKLANNNEYPEFAKFNVLIRYLESGDSKGFQELATKYKDIINSRDSRDSSGSTILHYAARFGRKEDVGFLTNLDLGQGSSGKINLNTTVDQEGHPQNGYTALMIAVSENHEDIAISLINQGADIKVKVGNEDVKSMALSLGRAEVVKLLEGIESGKIKVGESSGTKPNTTTSNPSFIQRLLGSCFHPRET